MYLHISKNSTLISLCTYCALQSAQSTQTQSIALHFLRTCLEDEGWSITCLRFFVSTIYHFFRFMFLLPHISYANIDGIMYDSNLCKCCNYLHYIKC